MDVVWRISRCWFESASACWSPASLGGALGWSSYLLTKDDELAEDASTWDKRLAVRTQTANDVRYLAYLIPPGAVVLVVGGPIALF